MTSYGGEGRGIERQPEQWPGDPCRGTFGSRPREAPGPDFLTGPTKENLMTTPKMVKTRHPGVFKRGGRYVAVWVHRGKQRKSFHRTLAEAKEAKARRAAGDTRPASRDRFEDYSLRWLDAYRGRTSRGLSDRTRELYRADMARWVVPFFRGVKLEQLEPPDIRAFIVHLERAGLRPASIRAIVAPLKAMLSTAVEDGVLRASPARDVRVGVRESQEAKEIRALTRAELSRLLAALPEQWRLLFELLAHSGLRISELIGLTWAHVEFGAKPRLLIRQQDCRGRVSSLLKTDGSRREIPLSTEMARRLWTKRGSSPLEQRVFLSPQGRHLSDGNLRRRVLKPACESAGVPWVTFHTFRHTCASLLFEGGKDVKQVAAWLGHKDPSLTLRRYISLMDSGVGDAEFLDHAVCVGNGVAVTELDDGPQAIPA
jgi:integrase